ncbi:Transportin-3 [Portunus trituberculatus]|uniref:Transportin-3 n=1 Tax=Portunus trituberculatus TaxID=210409 RepID=A0A5B7DCQ4_PORTR|nr:Transportin-3 [Portunus trituberculatus]
MGPTKLDMQEKSMIMALVGEGLSNREIGRKLRRSESAIRRTKKAAAVLGSGAVPERKKGTGRKRKTHPRTDKLLEREVKKDPFITAKELKEEHANVLGEVSVRTIQDRLQKHLKLPCRRTARKPLLTEKMKKQRLDFCKSVRGDVSVAVVGLASPRDYGKMEVDVSEVLAAIGTLYDAQVQDRQKHDQASRWLGQLQRSVQAWKVADQLLHLKHDGNSCFFAAQTLRTKIQLYFGELPVEAHASLRASMLEHMSHITEHTYQGIATQLCVALADLALHMASWSDPIGDLITQFGPESSKPNLVPLLEVLIALPEELHSRQLRLGLNRRKQLDEYFHSQVPNITKILVAEITFNFWYKLSEVLYKKNCDNVNEQFKPYVERLIEALYRHCQMEPDHDTILAQQDDFYEFRERVQELIKDVVFICGSKLCFQQMAHVLQAPDVAKNWNLMEAALFIMQSVAKNLIP